MLHVVDLSLPAPEIANPFPYPLDPFQAWACKAIDAHENVLVTAKTGSGKTLVGEYQIKTSLARGKRVFYTTPIKSLSNQKFHDLKEMGLSVGIMTGDIKFAPQSDVVVMTTEILCNLLFKKDTPSESFVQLSLNDVDAIVFDEVHYINNPERGKVWEQCIMLLPPEINLVMLSATIAEAPKFAAWIGEVKQKPIHLISTQYRVVPLVHTVGDNLVIMDHRDVFYPERYNAWLQSLEESKRKQREHARRVADRRRAGYDDAPVEKDSRQQSFLHQMNHLVETAELPALFFVFSRARCEEYAAKVSHDLLTSTETASVRHILDFHLHRYPDIQTSAQYHALRGLLEKGIAFHHSGLLPVLKEIVEILFGKGLVKLLFATETFAVGINMPTKTVVFTSFTKHSEGGLRMLRSDEYIQMAGRAGRRGKDTRGFVHYLPDREPAPLEDVRRMMTGGQQRVCSRMDFGYDFLIKTLHAHGLDWREVVKQSYWYTQHLEGIEQDKREVQRITAERDELRLTSAIVDDLVVRHMLENLVRETTNSKRKDAQRKLEAWKREHEGHRWDAAWKSFSRWTTLTKMIAETEDKIRDATEYESWITPRIEYLEGHGFLGTQLGLLAANVHEGHSIMMPVAFHSKALHKLTFEQLVGCLSLFGTSGEEREDEELTLNDCVHLEPETVATVQAFITNSIAPLVHSEKVPSNASYWRIDCTWADAAIRWVKGEHASLICGDYGLYEGNFIRAMLKIANLVDEWTTMATLTKDLDQLELLRDARQKIVKGVVVPDSLYLRT